jgi:hypothetical protein
MLAYDTHSNASAESQRFVFGAKRGIDWTYRSPEDVRTRLRRAGVAPRQRGLLMDMHPGGSTSPAAPCQAITVRWRAAQRPTAVCRMRRRPRQ